MKLVVDIRELVDLKARLAALPAQLKGPAIAAAINKVAAKGKTEVDRAVREEYVISADRVRNSISVSPASSARDSYTATISIFGSARKNGRSLNVIHFMERKVSLAQARKRARKNELYVVGRGGQLMPILRFTFKRGTGSKTIDGAFVGNKGRTVFHRLGKQRLPIAPVQVIDVPQMFRSKKVSQRVLDRINQELPVEIDRAIKAVTSRYFR